MLDAPAPAQEQQSPYLPKGPPEPLIFEDFEGVNTATTRPGVDDKEAAWLDGFMPLGPRRNLRTMYGLGPAIYISPGPAIAFFDFGNIGSDPSSIVVLNDGSIIAVSTLTSTSVQIAIPGTIQNPSRTNVGFAQYGSQYFLIVAKQTDGYFVWDGFTFFRPGDTFVDGNPIPSGISGTSVEIYAGRVWIADGPSISFSAPGSITDFSSANGGGNFISADSFLRVGFTQLKQTNGFLYLIADSSINYISGVQTSGSPAVTTFTNQNADPEVGTPWPSTVDVFNRNILFANAFGAHVSYGGAVTKISEKLDGVYNTVPNFGNIVPSAAKAIVFGKKIWILLLPIIDPVSNAQVNKLLMWNGKHWWASEQDSSLIYIQYQEINSVLTAWGTDGSTIRQLFAQPSGNFRKLAQSKLWDRPGGYQFSKVITRLWGVVQYFSAVSPALAVSIDNEALSNVGAAPVEAGVAQWFAAGNLPATWFTNTNFPAIWSLSGLTFSIFSPDAVGQEGVLVGLTLSTNAADMAVVSLMIQPSIAGYRG